MATMKACYYKRFQSTPPVKAATQCFPVLREARDISIHAAREGGDNQSRSNGANISISIHAAREGGDILRLALMSVAKISIHAAREGGDGNPPPPRAAAKISIHAAREGGDSGNE